jgi:hypothetical protein
MSPVDHNEERKNLPPNQTPIKQLLKWGKDKDKIHLKKRDRLLGKPRL